MAIEEKRDAVHAYCGCTACGDCALRRKWVRKSTNEMCIHIGSASEAELDWALRLINETDKNVTLEHDGCGGCKYYSNEDHEFPCSHCRGTVVHDDPLFTKVADLYEPKELENPYWQRICELADKQRAKGISTYGQGLENNTAAMLERINHLEEEMIDALMYCEWMKDKLEEGADNAS